MLVTKITDGNKKDYDNYDDNYDNYIYDDDDYSYNDHDSIMTITYEDHNDRQSVSDS